VIVMQWRIKPVLPVTKGMGAVAVVVLAVAFAGRDPIRWALALVLGIVLAVWAVRDLITPIRLAADATGVTVITGFARRRHVPWAQIERVRVDVSSRRGLRSELLELDAGESIFLFSAHELGALPEEVATALSDLRTA
jgi:hypothetical protein